MTRATAGMAEQAPVVPRVFYCPNGKKHCVSRTARMVGNPYTLRWLALRSEFGRNWSACGTVPMLMIASIPAAATCYERL